MKTQSTTGQGPVAVARALNLPISTKQCVEISGNLRYKNTAYAKKFLQDVLVKKRAVSFHRFTQDLGHRPGIGPGRYPQKAAKEFLNLINSVEANAQFKGLDTANLKIVKILANKASIPFMGGRMRRNTKRSHLEIEVREMGKQGAKRDETKVEKKVETAKVSVSAKAPEQVKAQEHATIPKPAIVSEKVRAQEQTESKKIEPHTSESPSVRLELSSAELLKKAQEIAAQLNKKEKDQKDTKNVANLYEELQKKGTLRSKP